MVWRGDDRPRRGDEATAASRAAQIHPVTGWLVVVDGPGKGSATQLGFGHNTIGRGPAMRVRLDFGDRKISRDTHATLTYDPKGNAFYLQQGKNLAYIERRARAESGTARSRRPDRAWGHDAALRAVLRRRVHLGVR